MSGPDTHKWWYGRRARLYALMHRNPASNVAVVHWAQLEPDMRVLDIGCGTGAAVNAAAPDLADGQAIGVDPSPDFIPIAQRRTQKASNASFQVATAEHLPFDKATFDVVWSVHSTHHWHHVGAGIGEALRVLRHGGRFLGVERHKPGRPWGINSDQANSLATALTAVGFADVFVEEHRVGRTHEFLVRGNKR
jgi:ubiquinone/menaquinone biosynthesis C-methylase UbiE